MPASRSTRALAALACAALLASGCGGPTAPPAPAPTRVAPECDAFVRYGDLSGTTVTVLEDGAGAGRFTGYTTFATCTGARIVHQGSGSIADRVRAGTPPDVGYVADHTSLAALVETGAARPAPSVAAAQAVQSFPPPFITAAGVRGTLYGIPVDATVSSLVWYAPRTFTARGYAVPQTWDELLSLSARIVADGGRPWCAGIADGERTGRVVADLLADLVLSGSGPEVYDQWVAHAVPFDTPPVAAALGRAGSILRNDTYVDAGIATTTVAAAGRPLLTGGCLLHRQSSAYAQVWPSGTTIAPDGDVFAFRMPPIEAGGEQSALVSGGFAVAFTDRREVAAFQAYLASPEWASARAAAQPPGWVSPNNSLPPDAGTDPLARLALGALQDPRTTLRYDPVDLMPPAVGAGSLPRALAGWVGGTGTAETLAAVEASWPR